VNFAVVVYVEAFGWGTICDDIIGDIDMNGNPYFLPLVER
jgi:hypothetical protein